MGFSIELYLICVFSFLQFSEPEVGIEILMERMKKLKESNEEEPTEEERLKRFEKVETQSAECK